MTHPTQPPSYPDDMLPFDAVTDEYVDAPAEDEEDDEGKSSSGKGGGKGMRLRDKYRVFLDPLFLFSNDDTLSDEDKGIAKLRKLGLAPMSTIMQGGTSFASENDLSRKVFMAEIGLINREIGVRDIADTRLFYRLDAKQAERRALFGIKTLDDIVAGAMGTAAAVVGLVSTSVADYMKDKREERRVERHIRSYEAGKETYSLDAEEFSESMASMLAVDFPVQDDQAAELAERYVQLREALGLDDDGVDVFAADKWKNPTPVTLTDSADLVGTFNTFASLVLAEPKPSRELGGDSNAGQEQLPVFRDFDPMGGN